MYSYIISEGTGEPDPNGAEANAGPTEEASRGMMAIG